MSADGPVREGPGVTRRPIREEPASCGERVGRRTGEGGLLFEVEPGASLAGHFDPDVGLSLAYEGHRRLARDRRVERAQVERVGVVLVEVQGVEVVPRYATVD